MLVVNTKHTLILTDYNGKRYAFYPGKPVDISTEIYQDIVRSGHINSDDIMPYAEPPMEAKQEEEIENQPKPRGRPRKA
jgi:hypothetical protein